jgi:UPF0755 protein
MVGPLTPKRVFLLTLCITALFLIVVASRLAHQLLVPAEKGGPGQTFIVQEGLSLTEIGEALEKKGIIVSKDALLVWARLRGYARVIKAGEYRLSPAMSAVEVLRVLVKGSVITHTVTIPEGYTRAQIAALLARKDLVDPDAFLELTGDSELAERFDISGPGLEGYLYPDTYRFARGLSPLTIIGTMVRRFFEIASPFREKIASAKMGLKDVVILASIVEKETGLPEERPLIASVFLNRMKRGMRLASDPTVIYGLKDFDGNLKREHLDMPTPYNTYVIKGLPPGPIANPGKAAIQAVLSPAETEYLYFVSRNDGSHHFSRTLAEHSRAVERFQKRKGRRPQKSP